MKQETKITFPAEKTQQGESPKDPRTLKQQDTLSLSLSGLKEKNRFDQIDPRCLAYRHTEPPCPQ